MSDKTTLIKSLLDTVKGILGSEVEEYPSKQPTSVSKTVTINTKIVKSLDEEQRKATFVVLAPDEVDLQGDTYSAHWIEKAADNFRDHCFKANLAHLMMVDNEDVTIIESYVAPADITIGDVSIKKGTWLQTWKFNDDMLWEGVKSGYWNGLSIQCTALVEEL